MHHVTRRSALGTLASVLPIFSATHQSALADVESPRVVLTPAARGLIVGPGMNAAGKDLRGCEFLTQDLTGAVFDGCNFFSARIDGCILKHASFRGAVFTGADVEVNADEGADFTDATINGARLSSTEGFYFSNLSLSPRQLMSTWSYKNKALQQCVIRGPHDSREAVRFDFRGADLRQATLRGDLSKCDFANARVYGTFFGNSTITFEQLASTLDFKQRSLRVRYSAAESRGPGLWEELDFSRIDLNGSDLSFVPAAADFTDARVNGCTIRKGLTRKQLYSTASYKRGDLTGLRLTWSDLSGCDFSGVNLTGSAFAQCSFADANFEDAVITDVDFRSVSGARTGCKGLTANQIKSTWNYKHGRMEGIRLPEELAEALKHEEAANANK